MVEISSPPPLRYRTDGAAEGGLTGDELGKGNGQPKAVASLWRADMDAARAHDEARGHHGGKSALDEAPSGIQRQQSLGDIIGVGGEDEDGPGLSQARRSHGHDGCHRLSASGGPAEGASANVWSDVVGGRAGLDAHCGDDEVGPEAYSEAKLEFLGECV